MSKKTRKKSSNTTGKRVATKVARAASASTGKSATKTRTAVAKKAAAKKTTKKTTKATKAKTAAGVRSKASHKAASKPLRREPAATVTNSSAIPLAEGATAPGFNLPRDGGDSVSLKDFAGKKLVLFFYPRADTPGCTREAIDFTRLKSEFVAAGTEVVGISADTVKAQESFRNKHQLSVPLVSDPAHEMLEAYGAWGEKSMYGRTFMGIIRTTVLVDSSGKVARIWRHVKVDGHAEAVLEAARSL
ncbi:peroxiredoxin Q/BCP [Bradyrhizobium japonicum]|jgi:thioredoxin-dependent peroxiredoxin|uniref:peroxiredoxin n=1 Tax=Bradyrhizobium TaxID=374 RepID=UPI0003A4B5D3|nr:MULTISPECIES: peroxiredoxin [Bradyrhizobium]MCP1730846.1 peroxiredoxin Q/BCP [Bradyrhizobium elkanii]MCP1931403.1 peroxiredoxin Q/BCP [Bradyrhizobium elkanii]MCS3480472.1 peroxiredoxin Q/BCP [Bradyrhizobium elkanii]MCS3517278.1 peroxiredoxin Q/BCP [Bradyrhizobium elkanii]MCS3574975.1 peroxiredoxin Q/BCP [Bradyrhizobium elkanii]